MNLSDLFEQVHWSNGKVNLTWGSFSKRLFSREFVFLVFWITWLWSLRNVISCRKVDSLKPKQTQTKKLADYKLVTWPISTLDPKSDFLIFDYVTYYRIWLYIHTKNMIYNETFKRGMSGDQNYNYPYIVVMQSFEGHEFAYF